MMKAPEVRELINLLAGELPVEIAKRPTKKGLGFRVLGLRGFRVPVVRA